MKVKKVCRECNKEVSEIFCSTKRCYPCQEIRWDKQIKKMKNYYSQWLVNKKIMQDRAKEDEMRKLAKKKGTKAYEKFREQMRITGGNINKVDMNTVLY